MRGQRAHRLLSRTMRRCEAAGGGGRGRTRAQKGGGHRLRPRHHPCPPPPTLLFFFSPLLTFWADRSAADVSAPSSPPPSPRAGSGRHCLTHRPRAVKGRAILAATDVIFFCFGFFFSREELNARCTRVPHKKTRPALFAWPGGVPCFFNTACRQQDCVRTCGEGGPGHTGRVRGRGGRADGAVCERFGGGGQGREGGARGGVDAGTPAIARVRGGDRVLTGVRGRGQGAVAVAGRGGRCQGARRRRRGRGARARKGGGARIGRWGRRRRRARPGRWRPNRRAKGWATRLSTIETHRWVGRVRMKKRAHERARGPERGGREGGERD